MNRDDPTEIDMEDTVVNKLSIALCAVVGLAGTLQGCGGQECGAGTVDKGGKCVPKDSLCPTGQVYENGRCVTKGCGTGFANVDGECVAVEDLCPDGEVWVNGACRQDRSCGAGTIQIGDECVPIDPMVDADLLEAAEPNDPLLSTGMPTAFELPANNDETILLGGLISPPADINGDTEADGDFDAWGFVGTAGQRLQIEATAVGAASVAANLMYFDDEGIIVLMRFALPVGSRNAIRQVVLPYSGAYLLEVSDKDNTVGRYQEFGILPGERVADWQGGGEYTYLLAVTPIANVAPIVDGTGALSADGDLRNIPQWRLSLTPGAIVRVDLSTENSVVAGLYWPSAIDYTEVLGEFVSGRHVVPSSGELLLTADYLFAFADDTGFSLRVSSHTSSAVDPVTAPVEVTGETLDPGGSAFYRFVANKNVVLKTTVDNLDSDLDPMIRLLDNTGAIVAETENDLLMVALEPGAYYVEIVDLNDFWDIGYFTYDLSLESFDLVSLGVVDETTSSVQELDIDTFLAAGDQAFFVVQVGALGDLTATVAPESNLDIAMQWFGSAVLAADSSGAPDFSPSFFDIGDADNDGPGGEETIERFGLEGDTVFLRLEAAEVVDATSTLADLTFAIDASAYAGWIREVEPNNFPEEATTLGVLDSEATDDVFDPTWGWGTLDRVDGATWDVWVFEVDAPAVIHLETHQLGPNSMDTTLDLFDSQLTYLDGDDDGGADGFSAIDRILTPGTYYVLVDKWSFGGPNPYSLSVEITEVFSLCAPGSMGCADGAVAPCNATGDGYDEPVVACALGCATTTLGCASTAEVEKNDTPADAQDLDTGASVAEGRNVIAGDIETGEDERMFDWYTFTLDTPASVRLETSMSGHEAFDTEMWLYESNPNPPPNLRLIDSDDNGGEGNYSLLGPVFLHPGEYWARVGFSTSVEPPEQGPYELFLDIEKLFCYPNAVECDGDNVQVCNDEGSAVDMNFVCALACQENETGSGCGHVVEVEVNNTVEQAQGLSILPVGRTVVEGVLPTAGDDDWFAFTLITPATVAIEIWPSQLTDPADLVDTNMNLRRVDGSVIEYDDDDGTIGTYSLIERVLPAGDYFLEVGQFSSSTGDYRLTLDVAENVPEITIVSGDPDDIVLNGVVANGDDQYFAITFTEDSVLAGTVTATVGDVSGIDVEVMTYWQDTYYTDSETLSFGFLAGTYIIRLDVGANYDEGFTVVFDPLQAPANIGSYAAGELIPDQVNDAGLLTGSNEYYTATFTEDVVLDLAVVSVGATVDLYIRNAAVNLVALETAAADESLEQVVVEAGTYLLEVVAEADVTSYVMTTSTSAIPVPVIDSVVPVVVTHGGTAVLTGSNFVGIESFTIGGVEIVDYTVDNDTQITIHLIEDSIPIGTDVPVSMITTLGGEGLALPIAVVHLVINEVDADQESIDTAEFIEISTGVQAVLPLDGYVVALLDGNNEQFYYAADLGAGGTVTTNANGFLLLAPADMVPAPQIVFEGPIQNGEDGVVLYQRPIGDFPTATTTLTEVGLDCILDAVVYESGANTDTVAIWSVMNSGAYPVANVGTTGVDSLQRCAEDGERRSHLAFARNLPTPGAANPLCYSVVDYALSDLSLPIVDNSVPTCVTINVPATGTGDTVHRVAVTVAADHGYIGDVEITMTDPASTQIVLASNQGGSNDLNSSYPVTFDDTAADTLTQAISGGAVCGGTDGCAVRPAAALSTYHGVSAVGAWEVCFQDTSAGIAGTIRSVSLRIVTAID